MTNRKITTNSEWYRKELAPLYCRYTGQVNPQPAYLDLDPESWELDAVYNAEIGYSTSFDVWYNRRFWIPLPCTLTGIAVANLLEDEDILSLVRTIFAGYQEEWDGNNNNYVGILSDKAQEALEELERTLDDRWEYHDLVEIAYVYDWIDDADLAAVTWDTLNEVVDQLEASAVADGVLLEGDVQKYLQDYLESKGIDDDEEILCT